MKVVLLLCGLLFAAVFPLCAQNWTAQDSIRLSHLLQQEGEVELNPEALRELGVKLPQEDPLSYERKSWLEFKEDLPWKPREKKQKVVLTLHPYATNTRYDWDPILQRKIKIDKNTWRGPFYELKTRKYPSNWAKNPLDAGDYSSLEKIEATGLRYVVMERSRNMGVGEWKPVGSGIGIDALGLMAPFTRDFWNFRGRKARKRTLEVLRTYATDTLGLH